MRISLSKALHLSSATIAGLSNPSKADLVTRGGQLGRGAPEIASWARRLSIVLRYIPVSSSTRRFRASFSFKALRYTSWP